MNVYPILQYQPGTLINCRRRLWRVDYQEDSVLYATAIDEGSNHTSIFLPFEAVSAAKLDLPSSNETCSPQAQKLMLDAFRLSMVNSTTPLRSLQTSRAIPIPYQLVPVVMALEQHPVRMLIADDVGLGKTIEAGLIIQELRSRGLAKKILVISPANLCEQWREALRDFFHIEAHVYSRENRRRLEKNLPAGSNLLEFHDAFVVSVDYAKAVEVKNLLLETNWDVVVIDEAHQVAKPHQSDPNHKVLMDRWDLAQALSNSSKIEHLLLLTATPHNGYTDSFASLIRLLKVNAVSGELHDPTIHADVAKHHVVQRRRSDVEQWLRNGSTLISFPVRDQSEVVITLSTIESETIKAVMSYGQMILENAKDATAHIRTLAGWAVLHLHKRGLSSPAALRCSLKNRRAALQNRLDEMLEEDPGLAVFDARANVLDEQVSDLYDEDEVIIRSEKVAPGTSAMTEAELRVLDELVSKAQQITPSKDSKLTEVIKNVVPDMLRTKDKLIIFTKYRDTMNYVAEQLQANPRFQAVSIFTIDGTLKEVQRKEVFKNFSIAKKAILVATDAISEGINLQHFASQIIHYELPWNPNRLEQRNGRVDRFGQKDPEVKIRTLVMDETLDATILRVLIQKTNQIRQDYGFSPPFFGDESSVLDLIREHGMSVSSSQPGLFEAIEIVDKTPKDPFSDAVLKRIKEDSFYGQTDLSLAFIEEQMTKTYNTVGTPAAVQSFVQSGLNRFNCHMTQNQDKTFRIAIQHPELQLPGLPVVIKSATFDPDLALDDPDIEMLDLGHPLVLRLMDLIKRETFNIAGGSYGRTAAFFTKDVSETTALLTLLVRFATQTTPSQVFEDLVTLAFPVYSERVLPPELADKLSKAKPVPGHLSPQELSEVVTDALSRGDLSELISNRIDARLAEILADRRAFQQSLNREVAWLDGSDNIAPASSDILAVTILWPA